MSFPQMVKDYPNRMEFLSQDDREGTRLLERYKPRIVVSPNSYAPVDFYRYYLPRSVVRDANRGGREVPGVPDRSLLVEIAESPSLYLDFQPPAADLRGKDALSRAKPVLYGRIYRDRFEHEGLSIPLLFLKYNPVFPYSGLPRQTSFPKGLGARVAGDPRAWHELDIHGAIHVVLDERSMRPVALILAQHNHHRTFLVGEDWAWPADDRVLIGAAEYSNEPYLIEEDQPGRWERAVGNPFKMDYLFGRTDRQPLTGGRDRVPSVLEDGVELDTVVEQVPLDDPLYTATIPLGNRGKILFFFESFYVAGPPGMDYYTLPELKNLADLMPFWYIDAEDDEFFRLIHENVRSFSDMDIQPALEHQKTRLAEALRRLGHG